MVVVGLSMSITDEKNTNKPNKQEEKKKPTINCRCGGSQGIPMFLWIATLG